jgi:hypothetical protein
MRRPVDYLAHCARLRAERPLRLLRASRAVSTWWPVLWTVLALLFLAWALWRGHDRVADVCRALGWAP